MGLLWQQPPRGSLPSGHPDRMRTRQLLPLLTATTALLGAVPASANSVPTWDRHTVLDTVEGAHFEIDMGHIAARHGHSAEARALGRLMVKDHEGELHAVQALAKRLGMATPDSPSAMEAHEISATSRHTGAAFDRAYARLEVGDHIRDIQTADGEHVEGRQPEVVALADKYRAMYLRHLAAFRKLAARVGAS